MATLLDAPKSATPAKVEEFVENQLKAARRRVRLLDYFMAGLTLAVISLGFLVVALLVDRYVETPRGTWWTVLAGYLFFAAGFLYLTLFRPSRRQINPYFAAHQVEQTVPNAKNSLVTWVDFEEDQRLPGSIRSAIGQKAARDLKGVDLNRAIENRKVLWLAIGAGLFLIANVVIAFLPPTRTELTLEEPKKGDITVFNNQDVSFQVRVHGRIPGPNDRDAVRLHLWYNPEDPEAYEERPMSASEDDRRVFNVTIPAKQVRNGFQYRVMAGNTATRDYTVTCKIIPEFNGFEVSYQYPAYLKRAPETNNDPNLLAPYGSTATLIVSTNREVKHGHIEIEGQTRTIDGQLVEGRPDAIQFTLTIEKEGYFRIWFTTPEGDKNQDPARLRLSVVDPKPVFRTFDIEYTYPEYLRFKPMTAADVREPEIEGPRGSTVVLTAKTSRGVKDARIEFDSAPPIAGEPVPDQPMWVRFKLPPLDKDTTARVSFTPTTGENASAARSIPIHALTDQDPIVEIKKPEEDLKEVPANGSLPIEGLATDDHGVDKLTLKMRLIGAENFDLVSKPYRGGMSFFRKEDNSWPTRVEYKDFVKLPDLRMEGKANWRVAPGMVIEYWLEATDNCTVPGPNFGRSKAKRFHVMAPKVPEQKNIDQQNRKLEKEQQAHEKKQDKTNATEKRDVKQEPPKGAEKQEKPDRTQQGENPGQNSDQSTDPGAANPDKRDNPPGEPPPGMDPDHVKRNQEIENAIKNAEQDGHAGREKQGPTAPETKVDPGENRANPDKGPMTTPPAEDHTPKTPPDKSDMGSGPAGETRGGNIDKNPTEDKGSVKDQGDNKSGTPPDGEQKQSYGGQVEKSGDKPDPKQPPKAGPSDKPEPTEKGTAHNQPKKPDPTDPKANDQRTPGDVKHDKDTTASDTKTASGEKGGMNDTPPAETGGTKPEKSPPAGEQRGQPKKDQVTDAGSPRGGPKSEDDAGGMQPTPKSGNPDDQQAKGAQKSGPGSPQSPPNSEQGELEREQGELEREINSTNPEVSEKAKATADRLIRNPKTREQTRRKLDEMKKNAKDELAKKKADQLRNSGEQAANNYDKEKPDQEKVDTLSKKLNSKDPREKQEAEERIKDWEKDPQNKKDLQAANEQLRKNDPAAADRVQNAMDKAEQARGGQSGDSPKLDEKQMKDLAKDLNGSDEKAKSDAQNKLKQMAKNEKGAKDAQEKFNEMADKAPDGSKEQQDLKNAADQAGKMASEMAKSDTQPKGGPPKLDEKQMKDVAKDLNSSDEKARADAENKLKQMANDQKSAKDAQQKFNEMADKAPEGSKEQQDLKNAADQAGKMADEMAKKDTPPNGGTPKLDPKELEKAARQLASGDPKDQKKAMEQLKEMMKDPKAREQAQEMLKDMADNAKTPEDKQALENAMKQAEQIAKEMGDKPQPKLDPKDLKDMAQKMAGKDEKAKQEATEKMKDLMKDPKAREQAMKMMEEMAKNAKNTPEETEALKEAMKQASEMAKNQPPKDIDPKDLAEMAKEFEKMDPKAKEELKKKFDEMMKDEKFREEMKKQAEQMAKQPRSPEEQRQLNEMLKQLGGGFPEIKGTPDPADPRNRLKAAELLLDKFKKNMTNEEFGQQLKWTDEQKAQWIKDQEATIAALRKEVQKADWRGGGRDVRSPVNTGPNSVKLDPKEAGNERRGTATPPPSGYADPYKKFTGGNQSSEPKR